MQWDSSMSLKRVVEITRRCKNYCLPIALRFWLAECTSEMIPFSIKCLFYAWHFAVCHMFLPFGLSHTLCENEQQSQARVRVRPLALSTGGILLTSPNSLKEQKAEKCQKKIYFGSKFLLDLDVAWLHGTCFCWLCSIICFGLWTSELRSELELSSEKDRHSSLKTHIN